MSIRKQKPLERGAGVLLGISSLPSPYGIGTFGQAAYDFVDFCALAGLKYWQVLPLGPTSYGDSPYQSFSAFAGNHYMIDLDLLVEEGLLSHYDIEDVAWGDDATKVDYGLLFKNRYPLLRAAFKRSCHKDTTDFSKFCVEQEYWLDDFALYMSIKYSQGNRSWVEWPDALRRREHSALEDARKTLANDVDFWKFCQFKFSQQWSALRAYAEKVNVKIIGDIPLYVSMDSADVWSKPHLFQLDEELNPTSVAGVPPDCFSTTGQLWGNPLYNWDAMELDNFAWWRQRMILNASIYDVVRIDHFIGIANYYSIPATDKTAKNGAWITGPGEKLIEAISHSMGDKQIIAEDLGIISPLVKSLLKSSGYPGMKIYQFAFDFDPYNPNLPGFYNDSIIVYGGNHDNETLVGFFSHQKRSILKYTRDYLNINRNRDIPWAMIRTAFASSAGIAIFQMQDYLELGNEAIMNKPATLGGNWQWRLQAGQITAELEARIKELTQIYGR